MQLPTPWSRSNLGRSYLSSNPNFGFGADLGVGVTWSYRSYLAVVTSWRCKFLEKGENFLPARCARRKVLEKGDFFFRLAALAGTEVTWGYLELPGLLGRSYLLEVKIS